MTTRELNSGVADLMSVSLSRLISRKWAQEVREVVGTHLELKPILSAAFEAGHDACIGDDHVEGAACREKFVRAGTNALQ